MLSSLHKKLLFRSNHRGCKETDILLGNFAEKNIANMSDEELALYAELIETQDNDIYNWIVGSDVVPIQYSQLIESIRRFHKL